MSYRFLMLPNAPTMTPELLRKVHQLVKAGATVIGPRPGEISQFIRLPALRC